MNKPQKNLRISKEQFIAGIKKRAKFLREREEFLESKKPHTKLKPITIEDIPEIKDEEIAALPADVVKEIDETI